MSDKIVKLVITRNSEYNAYIRVLFQPIRSKTVRHTHDTRNKTAHYVKIPLTHQNRNERRDNMSKPFLEKFLILRSEQYLPAQRLVFQYIVLAGLFRRRAISGTVFNIYIHINKTKEIKPAVMHQKQQSLEHIIHRIRG